MVRTSSWRLSGGTVPEEAVARMAPGAMIFALANPNPEVHPDIAHRHAAVVATGRSDFPNQINNVLAFPGIFRGAFDVNASRITEGMKLAAAEALANLISARGPPPRLHHPVPLRPPSSPRRSNRSSQRSPPRRRRPHLTHHRPILAAPPPRRPHPAISAVNGRSVAPGIGARTAANAKGLCGGWGGAGVVTTGWGG